MREPNEIWEDSHARRTICLRSELMREAIERSDKLKKNSFSEYITDLIDADLRYDILDRYNLAKLEISLQEGTNVEIPQSGGLTFWRKK